MFNLDFPKENVFQIVIYILLGARSNPRREF